MGLDFSYQPGQTPLDDDEREGLKIPFISTRGELDEFEQRNIQDAIIWTLSRRLRKEAILHMDFIRELHHRMFSTIWEWAGDFRTTNKNLGVDKYEIPVQLKILLEDALFWIEHDTYIAEEISLRTKHRMVSIHPFPNGNGRHSRVFADILISHVFQSARFSWGESNLVKTSQKRDHYLKALKSADDGDYQPLMEFARS